WAFALIDSYIKKKKKEIDELNKKFQEVPGGPGILLLIDSYIKKKK
ncbi:14493_t:CDS:2, partial [Racocetra fulgida]